MSFGEVNNLSVKQQSVLIDRSLILAYVGKTVNLKEVVGINLLLCDFPVISELRYAAIELVVFATLCGKRSRYGVVACIAFFKRTRKGKQTVVSKLLSVRLNLSILRNTCKIEVILVNVADSSAKELIKLKSLFLDIPLVAYLGCAV